MDKTHLSEQAWKEKGKDLLDYAEDVDRELKVARRTRTGLTLTLPVPGVLLLGAMGYGFFIGFSWIIAIVSVALFVALVANAALLTDALKRTGAIMYTESLPHRLTKAHREYHKWLDEDARVIPPKPEPKLTGKEVTRKFIKDNTGDDFPATELIDGYGRVLSASKPEVFFLRVKCKACTKNHVAQSPDKVMRWSDEHIMQYPHHTGGFELTKVDAIGKVYAEEEFVL